MQVVSPSLGYEKWGTGWNLCHLRHSSARCSADRHLRAVLFVIHSILPPCILAWMPLHGPLECAVEFPRSLLLRVHLNRISL